MRETLTNPVGWFEIHVQDMPRAVAFYEAVLGTRLQPLPTPAELEMMAFPLSMERRGAPGALVCKSGVASGGNSVLVYFSCEDCAEEAARIDAAGGRVERDKTSIDPYGHIVLAHDPDGNLFGLHSLR